MTTSDWGSTGSPRADFHPAYQHPGAARSQAAGAHFLHPAHAGGPARSAARHEDWGHAHVPGFGAPHAYGAAPGLAAEAAPVQEPGEMADTMTPGGRVTRTLNLLGGVLSIALVVGLGVWGYKLAVRDVTEVPVIRALTEPMREAPAEPGGDVARHQGLAVNVVAGEAALGGPVEQVVLAPAAVELSPEDVPARPVASVAAVAAEPGMAGAEAGTPADLVEASRVAAVDAAIAEALGLIDTETGDSAVETAAVAVVPGGIARSPRPVRRPADLVPASFTAPASATTPARARPEASGVAAPAGSVARPVAAAPEPVKTGNEITPTAIAAGVRLAQLGAFDSPDEARAQWQQIANRFGDMFVDRDWTIQMAKAGGKTFYRLRALGFDDLAQSQTFCATLMAANTICVPVVAP